MNRRDYLGGGILLLVVLAVAMLLGTSNNATKNSLPLRVVAAENTWGSIASQIGGNKVQVTSIITDPNADPHEYESNADDARAVSNANLVILNGAGYDSWGNNLLSTGGLASRKVLIVANALNKHIGDNPHFWYSPGYVNIISLRIENNLASLDPKDSGYFNRRYQLLLKSFSGYQTDIKNIKQSYSGVKVGATEDIFSYFAQAAGLNLISPPSFISAVAEGNDPPANSIVTFEQQLNSKQIKLLVYNTQTVTPLTISLRQIASAKQIPVVGVSEIIEPPNTLFQNWMGAQVSNIANALKLTGNAK